MTKFILSDSTQEKDKTKHKPCKSKVLKCVHNTTFSKNMNTILDTKLNTILDNKLVKPVKKPLQF